MIKSPVVIFTYRKIESLDAIFAIINEYCPPILYIISNAPSNEQDLLNVLGVRNFILNYPFQCKVELLFSEQHLDLIEVFHQNLNTLFEIEETLIVLEDDTIPNITFFDFCNYMLNAYKDDNNVGSISGCNLNAYNNPNFFFFSDYCLPCWGWATWKKCWKLSNKTNTFSWNTKKTQVVQNLKFNDVYFYQRFDLFMENPLVWDMLWSVTLLLNERRIIYPGINLVSNKGYNALGHFTKNPSSPFSNLSNHRIDVESLYFHPEIEELYSNVLVQFLEDIKKQNEPNSHE